MRLINTSTGLFREFQDDSQRPRYAILSHTWGDEEISYLDLLFLTNAAATTVSGVVQLLLKNPSRDSQGFKKVQKTCELARSRGLEWVWIDSCCIDKSSSAELSEAINSMWTWYRAAAECYVFLFDVTITPKRGPAGQSSPLDAASLNALSAARWFTRGWTLQELLAPPQVLFFNNKWDHVASKAELSNELSVITKIPLVFLNGTVPPDDGKRCSVAMKMSWVSKRQTTRTEDMAYCMLGLFDVHMPLIYGEGRKAFMRLQLEILKKSDDDSLFAWCAPLQTSGLLATWPTAFAESGNIVQLDFPDDHTPWLPPSMTSIGLEMRGRYQRLDDHQAAIDRQCGVQTISTGVPTGDFASMIMHCSPCDESPLTQQWRLGHHGKALLIVLRRIGSTWQRVNCEKLNWHGYGMYEPSSLDAYKLYYIAQEGL